MSSVNIRGVVNNISKNMSAYTPIIEAIVNSIHSIEKAKKENGEIVITFIRDDQKGLGFDAEALGSVQTVLITDNGEGFTDENTDSFDMLYSEQKKDIGGKGFGRFSYLRYFEKVDIESSFSQNDKKFKRSFDFVLNNKQKIISNDIKKKNISGKENETIVSLNNLKRGRIDKKLNTIARKLLEKLLIFFIQESYSCPKISLKCDDKVIVLNDILGEDYPEIQKIDSQSFSIEVGEQKENFKLKIFKIFFPENQKSKICLTAHNREVTDSLTHQYVPEFEDNFVETMEDGTSKDYLIKTYVIGEYLDKNVSLERNGFSIPKTHPDMYFNISQKDIEKKAAELTKNSEAVMGNIFSRQTKKVNKLKTYVETKAPWYKEFISDIDIDEIPFHLDDEKIDLELNKVKFKQEIQIKKEVKEILEGEADILEEEIKGVVDKISKIKLTELAHYVALRKSIIKLFKRSLEIKDDGKYQLEDTVHSIIFPTRSNSDDTPYSDHNLWLIDEKLNFSEFISSDKKHIGESRDRSDLLIYNKKIAFRTENESSNPITIFEFKRPKRDDFVTNPKDDPVLQVLKYVKQIKEGSHLTPKGRDINVSENTPFYGYVVCDLNKKVTDWLHEIKEFKVMPDGSGWYRWFDNNNLYIEFISWDKVWKDAEMRNKVFFNKLGIE